MAEVVLKHIKKVYPDLDLKKGKNTNLKVTDEGVLAVRHSRKEVCLTA